MNNRLHRFPRRRTLTAVLAGVLTVALLLGGVYAWTDFKQSATNRFRGGADHDVLLHDDFEPDVNKDVYVENTGENDLIVRIRFNEYLQIGNTPIVGGNPSDKSTWSAHLFHTPDPGICMLPTHDYYRWSMSGQAKIYKPGTGEIGNDIYTAGQAFPDGSYAKETLPANPPIFMEEYIADKAQYDAEPNGRWILDQDGWAYWSKLLPQGEATNLLLDNVTMIRRPDDNYYYAIDVVLQAANKTEAYKLLTDANGDRAVTDEAEMLIDTLSPASPPASAVISGISITVMPDKIRYIAGEAFLPDGMVVTAQMSDGTQMVLSEYNVFPTVLDTAGDDIPVTISANGKSAVLKVRVDPAAPDEIDIQTHRLIMGTDKRGNPMEWQVLEVDTANNKMLIIPTTVVAEQLFHENDTYPGWGGTLMRQFLNGTFYQEFFTPEERQKILLTDVWTDRSHSNKTPELSQDFIFLLSDDEIKGYWNTNSKRIPQFTHLGDKSGTGGTVSKANSLGSNRFWLRNSRLAGTATYVGDLGEVVLGAALTYGKGASSSNRNQGGVRPVMWVTIK